MRFSATALPVKLALLVMSIVPALTACGPNYLTPDQVRSHIENPGGEVSSAKMPFAVDDLFRAKRASGAEDYAFFLKGDAPGASMAMSNSVSYANPVADVFCAASLVASIAAFDDCTEGTDCEAEFIIDSCLLRMGDNGDELADGRIVFYIKSVETETAFEDEMRITFEAFSSTFTSDVLDSGEEVTTEVTETLDGIIAVASTQQKERDEVEAIFSADVDYRVQKADVGMFEDPILERSRATAAMRFTAIEEEGFSSGTLDLLAFVDETDDTRDESVVISFAAESRDVGNLNLSNATLEVSGSNGNFICSFSSAEETLGAETSSYHSEGQCTDLDSGEEWTFNSDVEAAS